jgi:hypothetical protein
VISYYETIESRADEICGELSAGDCDTLLNMARAIWVTATQRGGGADVQRWFEMREEVIYYNLRQQLEDDSARVYLHMGAFHTNKHVASAGSRVYHDFEPVGGKVVSVGPAFGAESRIMYFNQEMPLPAMPIAVAGPLAEHAADPVFVSSHLPDAACTDNPLAEANDELIDAPMAQTVDGYLHIRRLTPENRPDDSTLPAASARLRDHFDRVRALEREALAARAAAPPR